VPFLFPSPPSSPRSALVCLVVFRDQLKTPPTIFFPPLSHKKKTFLFLWCIFPCLFSKLPSCSPLIATPPLHILPLSEPPRGTPRIHPSYGSPFASRFAQEPETRARPVRWMSDFQLRYPSVDWCQTFFIVPRFSRIFPSNLFFPSGHRSLTPGPLASERQPSLLRFAS